jgi:hypothetical protein
MFSELNEKEEAIKQMLLGAGNISTIEIISQGLNNLGWNIFPVWYQNIIVGAIIEKNGEFHTSIAPDYQKKWNPRPYIKKLLYPALDKYGVIYSDAKKDDLHSQKWLLKIGFEFLREDNENFYYLLKNKKFL